MLLRQARRLLVIRLQVIISLETLAVSGIANVAVCARRGCVQASCCWYVSGAPLPRRHVPEPVGLKRHTNAATATCNRPATHFTNQETLLGS